ncbi:MAG: GEVED domain-containing protein [Saprospiraceae bacterium]
MFQLYLFFQSINSFNRTAQTAGRYILVAWYRHSGGQWITVGDQLFDNPVLIDIIDRDICESPDKPNIVNSGYAYGLFSWNNVPGASAYQTRIREIGSSSWSLGGWYSSQTVRWNNLKPCTNYEIQVQSRCDNGESDFTISENFQTEGCDDIEYCYSYGSSSRNWIRKVEVNSISNITGSDYGYGNYQHVSTSLTKGLNYPIKLEANSIDTTETVYWRIWIDLNQDFSFDNSERLFDGEGSNIEEIMGNIQIPQNASSGITRMRISMMVGLKPGPCNTGNRREVEDYTVNILEPDNLSVDKSVINLPSNPGTENFLITSNVNWSVSESINWLTVSPSSGSNNRTITINFQENTSTNSRSGIVSVQGSGIRREITINQTGKPVQLNTNKDTIHYTYSGGSTKLDLFSNHKWRIDNIPNWIQINQVSGSGNNTLSITCDENTTTVPRQSMFLINSGTLSKEIIVIQEGKNSQPFIIVNPSPIILPALSGTTNIDVSSNSNWLINESISWLNLDIISGTNNESITLSFDTNPDIEQREEQFNLFLGMDNQLRFR